MARIPVYQVDAFTDKPFKGNPAAICPLDAFLSDDLMQAIAAENNLAETAYYIPYEGDEADYHLRWFTPTTEVKLCGHATLAAAHVIFKREDADLETIRFQTLSGVLSVTRQADGKLELCFPALRSEPIDMPAGLGAAMSAEPEAVFKGDDGDRDLLLLYRDADSIRNLNPDLKALKAFAPYGFIATAPGEGDVDFVSRCFFPNHGIDEDPVTGSAHCMSGPYWENKLGKDMLFAQQISDRQGDLWLRIPGDGQVYMAGHGVEVLVGQIILPE